MIIPYCGTPPVPAELWARWNLDPVLMLVLALAAAATWRRARDPRTAVAGVGVAALALLSPLCALSVALFSARVGQHMVLALIAAPLIALGFPTRATTPFWRQGLVAGAFAVALWLWHLPGAYEATFRSDAVYWTMHATLFGSAILLWRDLLHHRADRTLAVLGLGAFTTVQMGLLGAILTFASAPLFSIHIGTTFAWGLDPVADQSLGGLLMWVPGTAFFLVAAWRSLATILPATPARG